MLALHCSNLQSLWLAWLHVSAHPQTTQTQMHRHTYSNTYTHAHTEPDKHATGLVAALGTVTRCSHCFPPAAQRRRQQQQQQEEEEEDKRERREGEREEREEEEEEVMLGAKQDTPSAISAAAAADSGASTSPPPQQSPEKDTGAGAGTKGTCRFCRVHLDDSEEQRMRKRVKHLRAAIRQATALQALVRVRACACVCMFVCACVCVCERVSVLRVSPLSMRVQQQLRKHWPLVERAFASKTIVEQEVTLKRTSKQTKYRVCVRGVHGRVRLGQPCETRQRAERMYNLDKRVVRDDDGTGESFVGKALPCFVQGGGECECECE